MSLGGEGYKKTPEPMSGKLICVLGVLGAVVVALVIVVAAVGVKNGKAIQDLKKPEVYFSNSASSNKNGFSYAGSLYRGSGFWGKKKDMPKAMSDSGIVAVGDFIYIIGGIGDNATVYNTTYRFDPQLHTYTLMAALPKGPRFRFGIAAVDSKIYVIGGRESDASPAVNSTLIYDTLTDKWSDGAPTIMIHSDPCAASVNGKVYLIGGYNSDYQLLAAAEEYDPKSDSWKKMTDMPTPRGDLMCAGIESTKQVFAIGGFYDSNFKANMFSNKSEMLDTVRNTWTTMPDLLTPRGDAAAMVLPGDKIMVVGGEGHYRNKTSYKYPKHVVEVYYTRESVWIEKAMIPTARFRVGGAVSGGLAFAIGGADLCISENDSAPCPVLPTVEVYLDVDHPPIFNYLKGSDSWPNSQQALIYPL